LFSALQVNEGRLEVDQSALTGESLPVTLKKGMSAQMGSTAVRGEVNATVKDTGKNTFFGRTAMLLQTVDSLGNLQKVLMRIVLSLTVSQILLSFSPSVCPSLPLLSPSLSLSVCVCLCVYVCVVSVSVSPSLVE
jgi:cation transport ATPase